MTSLVVWTVVAGHFLSGIVVAALAYKVCFSGNFEDYDDQLELGAMCLFGYLSLFFVIVFLVAYLIGKGLIWVFDRVTFLNG